MDLCSTKHTCSNSACQMFADKWVVLTNKKSIKKLYQINNDTGKCQTTFGGYRPGSNQILDHIGLPSAMDRYCLARHCVVSVEA